MKQNKKAQYISFLFATITFLLSLNNSHCFAKIKIEDFGLPVGVTIKKNTEIILNYIEKNFTDTDEELLKNATTKSGIIAYQDLIRRNRYRYSSIPDPLDIIILDCNEFQLQNLKFDILNQNQRSEYFVFSFSSTGEINDIRCSLHSQYRYIEFPKVISRNDEYLLTQFLERYIKHYNDGVMGENFRNMFTDTSEIIVGSVEVPNNADHGHQHNRIQLFNRTINEYIINLKEIFMNRITISYDTCYIFRNSNNQFEPENFGVFFHQKWICENEASEILYHDKGWVFLIIDMSNRENPKIVYRYWDYKKPNGLSKTKSIENANVR